jgi:hypothetical protein
MLYIKDVLGEFGYVTDLGVDLLQTLDITAKKNSTVDFTF